MTWKVLRPFTTQVFLWTFPYSRLVHKRVIDKVRNIKYDLYMLQYSRQSLMFIFCTVFLLDIVFLLAGPVLVDSAESNPDWLYSEFELEETEESGEEEPLIQDASFLSGVSISNSLIHFVEFSVKESDHYEIHASRGPPRAC
ncbi:hypothetical protein Pan241w_47440 [Gimesia alba]|uniref:Uncharacterized protein n=2 Tax=Gimesia alba TaxID=2527973 RepID=A0A517RL75_9PLAN|nr:hypothetical protein Pan241w_47440 [Gimesia alba]